MDNNTPVKWNLCSIFQIHLENAVTYLEIHNRPIIRCLQGTSKSYRENSILLTQFFIYILSIHQIQIMYSFWYDFMLQIIQHPLGISTVVFIFSLSIFIWKIYLNLKSLFIQQKDCQILASDLLIENTYNSKRITHSVPWRSTCSQF